MSAQFLEWMVAVLKYLVNLSSNFVTADWSSMNVDAYLVVVHFVHTLIFGQLSLFFHTKF